MKIVYIGNFGPPHSTENDYRQAFEELGHEVIAVQENDGDALKQVVRAVQFDDASMVLYTRTWGLPLDEAVQVWEGCAERGVITAGVHLDRWRGLNRAHEVGEQAMFRVAHLFTADGDFADEWPELPGGGVHHWLPPGVRGSEVCESDPYPPWVDAWDVAFVGSAPTPQGGHYHDVEWPHRRQLVAWLRETYGERFVHVGNGGQPVNDDSGNTLTTLRGHWCNRLQRSVKVTVGDSCLVTRTGKYWSDRVPETWGRGGFLIHPGVDALAMQLDGTYPGWAWTPGDWDELRHSIDYWLAHPVEREAERLRIAGIIRAEHTYRQRAQTILETVGLA